MKISDLIRIDELREVPFRRDWRSPSEVKDWLSRNGYRYIGSGSFSDVYGKDQYIVKVHHFRGTEDTAKCMIAYFRLAMRSNNPHFPKIHMLRVFKGEEKGIKTERPINHYIVGTEKLYPVNANNIKIPKGADPAEYASFLLIYVGIAASRDYYGHIRTSDELSKLANQYKKSHPNDPLVQASDLIEKLAEKYPTCFIDVGGENIMMRKDGTIVFSDPIADDIFPFKE